MVTRKVVLRSVSALLSFGLLLVVIAPRAHADAWNRRTLARINRPVEIPGRILYPGTYTLTLAAPGSDADAIAIKNHQTGHFIGLYFAMPAYRQNGIGRLLVTLAEGPADSPPAISEWFYPDQHNGLKLIYSHSARESAATWTPKSHPAKS